jgi:hypothetical protein
LSRHLTWRPAKLARPRRRFARPGQPAHFARPAGGTVEFLGRDPFRLAVGMPWQKAAGRSPICVWCRWPHQRQPQQPNLAAPLKHRRFATQHDCEVPLKKTSRKRGTINVRALDMRAMICVLCRTSTGSLDLFQDPRCEWQHIGVAGRNGCYF